MVDQPFVLPLSQVATLYRMTGTFGGDFNLVVGRFSSNCQIKITANADVLSQVLINLTMNEFIRLTKYLPICFSS